MTSLLVFNGVCAARFLVFFVMLCRSLFVLLSFFGHCVVYSSSIYRFCLSLWYLQTFLNRLHVTEVPEKAIFRSVTVYNKQLSSQWCMPAQIEQVQEKY